MIIYYRMPCFMRSKFHDFCEDNQLFSLFMYTHKFAMLTGSKSDTVTVVRKNYYYTKSEIAIWLS